LQIPATLFVISDFIGGWNDWDTIRVSRRRHMDHRQLKELQAEGLAIGSHSCTHLSLTYVDRATLLSEIRGSKHALAEMLGVPIRTFAYPGGDVDDRVRDMTARHYDLAFATSLQRKGTFGDPYLIPRFDPSFCRGLNDFRRKLVVYAGKMHGQP
jgi:peptidoglycan/xylan/chitin deacetylase (PgdA/CDA1 family)